MMAKHGVIHTFLDNDSTGVKCTNRFLGDYEDKVMSHSVEFAPYKDLNEALKRGVEIKFPTILLYS